MKTVSKLFWIWSHLYLITNIQSASVDTSINSEKNTIQPASYNTTTYDQRQSGKYNIQLSIKDVAIISVEGDGLASNIGDNGADFYQDYYDYDIDDLTISPISSLLGGISISKPTKPPQHTLDTGRNKTTTMVPVKNSTFIDITSTTTLSVADTTTSAPNNIKKRPTVVILNGMDSVIKSPKPHEDLISAANSQQQNIPVQVVMEPILKPKLHTSMSNKSKHTINRLPLHRVNHFRSDLNTNLSDRFSTKERRHETNRCSRRGAYRDRYGNCRIRRSGVQKIIDTIIRSLDIPKSLA